MIFSSTIILVLPFAANRKQWEEKIARINPLAYTCTLLLSLLFHFSLSCNVSTFRHLRVTGF